MRRASPVDSARDHPPVQNPRRQNTPGNPTTYALTVPWVLIDEFLEDVLSENSAHRFPPGLRCGRPVEKVQHAAHPLPPANHTLATGSLPALNEFVPDALMIPLRGDSDRSHEPLCVGMTVRRAHRRPDHPDGLPFKERHPRTAPLGVAIADQHAIGPKTSSTPSVRCRIAWMINASSG